MRDDERPPDAILFDFDGLVLDTETSEFLTVAESFADHGLELSRPDWVAIIGTADHPHWMDMLEEALGRPLDDREAILETRRARHHARISDEPLRPGVIELATAATEAGVGVAIASSSPSSARTSAASTGWRLATSNSKRASVRLRPITRRHSAGGGRSTRWRSNVSASRPIVRSVRRRVQRTRGLRARPSLTTAGPERARRTRTIDPRTPRSDAVARSLGQSRTGVPA